MLFKNILSVSILALTASAIPIPNSGTSSGSSISTLCSGIAGKLSPGICDSGNGSGSGNGNGSGSGNTFGNGNGSGNNPVTGSGNDPVTGSGNSNNGNNNGNGNTFGNIGLKGSCDETVNQVR